MSEHSRAGSKPLACIFTVVPLDPRFHDGFSARWAHFVRALTPQFDLDITAVRGLSHGPHLLSEAFRPTVATKSNRVLDAIVPSELSPLWVRALRRVLRALNLLRHVPNVPGIDAVLKAQSPAICIFFRHELAHFAFEFPPKTPCVFVFEEALCRTGRAGTRSLFRRAWDRIVLELEMKQYRRLTRQCAVRGPLVVISEEEKRLFSDWLPADRICLIPHGLDSHEFVPSKAQPEYEVGIFGLLGHERNYVPTAALIHRARALAKSAGWRWILVGHDPHESLKRLASPLIHVTGSVPDVRPYYPRAQVIVVPARVGTGSKTTILQAWAMQRPVVTTLLGTKGLPVQPGQNALVAEDDDGLIEAVLSVLNDSTLASRLARAGRATFESQCDVRVQAGRFAELCSMSIKTIETHKS